MSKKYRKGKKKKIFIVKNSERDTKVDESIQKEPRQLSVIAADIHINWKEADAEIRELLMRMSNLKTVNSTREGESGRKIIENLLIRMKVWHSKNASRIKSELRSMLDAK